MKCGKLQKRIEEYLSGNLGSQEVEQIKEHLLDCTVCAKKIREMKYINNMLNSMEPVKMPLGYEQRFYKELIDATAEVEYSPRPYILSILRPAAAGLSFAAMLLLGVFFSSLEFVVL